MTDKPVTRLAHFLPYQLSITSNAVSNLIAREYRSRFGLKVPEWRVMAVLGDVDEATQRELVEYTRMDKVAVNRACKTLGERHLLRRMPNESDGRSHHLELTETGRQLYDEIMPLAWQMEREVTSVLDEREYQQMAQLLERMRKRADSINGE